MPPCRFTSRQQPSVCNISRGAYRYENSWKGNVKTFKLHASMDVRSCEGPARSRSCQSCSPAGKICTVMLCTYAYCRLTVRTHDTHHQSGPALHLRRAEPNFFQSTRRLWPLQDHARWPRRDRTNSGTAAHRVTADGQRARSGTCPRCLRITRHGPDRR